MSSSNRDPRYYSDRDQMPPPRGTWWETDELTAAWNRFDEHGPLYDVLPGYDIPDNKGNSHAGRVNDRQGTFFGREVMFDIHRKKKRKP